MATIKLFGLLRNLGSGSLLEVQGETVAELLSAIQRANPELYAAIVDEQGDVKPHVHFMVGGRAIELDNGLGTRISAEDEIAIFPPIAGGGFSVQWSVISIQWSWNLCESASYSKLG